MSIPILAQVYDEVRRLSVAGSAVAAGDFRLKKLAAPLEQAGQKAPVLAKVGQSVSKLVESNEQAAAEALLELSTLVNAILYTQGETGLEGPLERIESIDLGQQQTQSSARLLKPLLDALSTTGSGRLEVIKDAHQRAAFRDLRLVGPALAAIDDSYPEVAEFIAGEVLPMYGQAILPSLREKFDVKGRAGHLRRLTLMQRLDPAGTRDLVKQALDDGSKEIRVAAIECLGESPEDLAFLLEQVKAKAKEVRAAAYKALAKSTAGDALAALRAAFNGADLDLIWYPLQQCGNPDVLKFILDDLRAQVTKLLAGKEKDKAKRAGQVSRIFTALNCLQERDDKATESFLLELFERREELAAVPGDPSGKDLRYRLIAIMAGCTSRVQRILADAHAFLAAEELEPAVLAATCSYQPDQVFDQFSPYLIESGDDKKKRRGANANRREAVISGLLLDAQRMLNLDFDVHIDTVNIKPLDPRWLDLAVKQQLIDLVLHLATAGHKPAEALLLKQFEALNKNGKDEYELQRIVDTMVRMPHPAATDSVIAVIRRHTKGTHIYGLHWVVRLIPDLPKDALPKFEALVPTLPEKAADQLVEYVAELKNRSATA